MQTTSSRKDVYFDVDDTLVMWGMPSHPGAVTFSTDTGTVVLVPNKVHIDSLINAKAVGHTTIVWSGDGRGWAAYVLEMLGLEQYVDFVHNKPDHFYDDMPAAKFMKNRIYHGFEG